MNGRGSFLSSRKSEGKNDKKQEGRPTTFYVSSKSVKWHKITTETSEVFLTDLQRTCLQDGFFFLLNG
jgi:hypothetical protein